MTEIDDPGRFVALPDLQRRAVADWLRANVAAAPLNGVSSYELKHVFEKSQGVFYAER